MRCPSLVRTRGLEMFDHAYDRYLFDRIFTTNLIYQKPELLEKEYGLKAELFDESRGYFLFILGF